MSTPPTILRRRQALFLTLDRNSSGTLDWDDFHRAAEVIRAERGWPDDHVKHQALLHAMREFWDELSARVDANRNGAISAVEWMRFHDSLADEIRDLGRVPLWALGFLQSIHAVLDLDGDGTISGEEYALWLRAIESPHDAAEAFRRLDTNGDGLLAFEEMEGLYSEWMLDERAECAGAWLFTGATR